jgi:hypothetical protein
MVCQQGFLLAGRRKRHQLRSADLALRTGRVLGPGRKVKFGCSRVSWRAEVTDNHFRQWTIRGLKELNICQGWWSVQPSTGGVHQAVDLRIHPPIARARTRAWYANGAWLWSVLGQPAQSTEGSFRGPRAPAARGRARQDRCRTVALATWPRHPLP